MTIKANNPTLISWISVDTNSDFSIQNLPFGIYTDKLTNHRCCSAIGEYIIDLTELNNQGFFKSLAIPTDIFNQSTLNDFISLGKETTRAVRNRLSELLDLTNNELQSNQSLFNTIFKKTK